MPLRFQYSEDMEVTYQSPTLTHHHHPHNPHKAATSPIGVSHGGGHCAIFVQTRSSKYQEMVKVGDYAHCTEKGPNNNDAFRFTLHKYLPAECDTDQGCRIVWLWTPKTSGVCETYMNCWDVRIQGAVGGLEKVAPLYVFTESTVLCVYCIV